MSYAQIDQVESLLGESLSDVNIKRFKFFSTRVTSFIDEELNSSFRDVAPSTRKYFGDTVNLFTEAVRNVTKIEVEDFDEYDLDKIVQLPINNEVKSWFQFKSGRPFPKRWVEVTGQYSLGACPPPDIIALASYLVYKDFELNDRGDIKSENIEGYSRTYESYDYANDEKTVKVLDKYKVKHPIQL